MRDERLLRSSWQHGTEQISQAEKQQSGAETAAHPSEDMAGDLAPEQPPTAPPPATNGQGCPRKGIEWTREQRLALWANIASGISAGAAIAAFGILIATLWATQDSLTAARKSVVEAHEQAVQAKRQADYARDTYLATNRAWLDLNVDPASVSVQWKEGVGANIYAKLTGTNYGNSPALEAMMFSIAVVSSGYYDIPRDLIKNKCVDMAPINGGDTVFTNKSFSSRNPTFVSWYGVKNFFAMINGVDEVVRKAQSENAIMIYYIACAVYKIAGDDKWHHTGRLFEAGRITGADQRSILFSLKVGENLESDRLVLVKEDVGAYAD